MNRISIYAICLAVLVCMGVWFVLGRSGKGVVEQSEQIKSSGMGDGGAKNGIVDDKGEIINSNKIMQDNIDINKITKAIIHTNKGDIELEFFREKTPNTVANFVKLAFSGFYDGVKFHRVIKDFMIQAGDPLTKDDTKQDYWGTGGPGYKFNDEIGADNHNNSGTIAMANAGPNTNGSQFFINVKDNNFLDTKHTVFGKIVSGMEVVKAIETTPTGPMDRPIDPIIINSITLK